VTVETMIKHVQITYETFNMGILEVKIYLYKYVYP